MIKDLKDFSRFAALPLFLFIFLGIFLLTYQMLGLPSFDQILQFAQNQFDKHGYLVVFIAALLEGFLFLNWFFPGSVVVVMGAVFAQQGQQNLIITLSLIMLGLFLMSIVNFYIGKYGWYKLFLRFGLGPEIAKMQKRLEKYGFFMLILSYIHPHVGGLSSTAAGILQLNSWKFAGYSFLGFLFWGTFWTTVVHFVGEKMISIINFQNLMIIMVVWIIVMGIQYFIRKIRKIPEDLLTPETD